MGARCSHSTHGARLAVGQQYLEEDWEGRYSVTSSQDSNARPSLLELQVGSTYHKPGDRARKSNCVGTSPNTFAQRLTRSCWPSWTLVHSATRTTSQDHGAFAQSLGAADGKQWKKEHKCHKCSILQGRTEALRHNTSKFHQHVITTNAYSFL